MCPEHMCMKTSALHTCSWDAWFVDNSPPAQSPAWRVSDDESRFSPAMLFAAAKMYYEEDATQATIAEKLGTSRATVSRLLTEARRRGIVRIEVRNPVELDHNALIEQLELTLGLRKVYL